MIDYIFEGFELFEYGRVIEEITADEINELIKSQFKDEYFALSVIYPIEERK